MRAEVFAPMQFIPKALASCCERFCIVLWQTNLSLARQNGIDIGHIGCIEGFYIETIFHIGCMEPYNIIEPFYILNDPSFSTQRLDAEVGASRRNLSRGRCSMRMQRKRWRIRAELGTCRRRHSTLLCLR